MTDAEWTRGIGDELGSFIAEEVNRRWPGHSITVMLSDDNRKLLVKVAGVSERAIDLPEVRQCCHGHYTFDTARMVWALKDDLEAFGLVDEPEI